MPSMKASSDCVLAGYGLESLREDVDFSLYRGRQHGNPSPILVVTLAAEQPSAQSLRRLEHEYSLAADLDPAWAASPLELTRTKDGRYLYSRIPAESHWIGFLSGTRGTAHRPGHVRKRFATVLASPLQAARHAAHHWGALVAAILLIAASLLLVPGFVRQLH
jgi:hypothetical protein